MRALSWLAVTAGLVTATAAHAQPSDEPPRWTLPAGGLLANSKAEIESKSCCAANGGAAVENSDARTLATAPGLAARAGGVLRLKLADNRTFKLTDCIEGPACEDYRFRTHRLAAWWPNQHIYVVAVQLIEGSVAYLISDRDGRTLQATAPPALSPSGRLAIALTSNLMEGVQLELIDFSRDPPTLSRIEDYPKCAGADANSFLRPKPVWIDDRHVRFEGKSPNPDDKPNTRQLLRIEGGKTAWEC